MSQWPNPIPPVPFLRERYPLSGGSLPSVITIIFWSVAMAVISITFFAPIMDKIVLKCINVITPSFVPPTGELKTQRQAIERLAYQTVAITGHLLILWPILLAIVISLVEGIAWLMGSKSPSWIPYIWSSAEFLMGNSLFTYYKDMPKVLLQLDQLRDNDLLESTERFLRGPNGQSRTLGYDRYDYEITLKVDLVHQFRISLLPKPAATMAHLRTIGLDSIATFISFIADRSSNITCPSPKKLWAHCGPFMRLGVPVGSPILALVTVVTIGWWSARNTANGGDETGWAPLMCQRELRRRVNQPWGLQKPDWKEVRMYEYQMQEGRFLWGCPWKPNLRQMGAWIRHN